MISFPATFAIVSVIAVLTGRTVSTPVKYDQRQEGDLNVRTDVEDVVFVVVPPKDLINAGMGLVAATAADLLRKNYGGIGPERWPLRTSSKLGFVPLEKSPYKIDLERSEVQVKKISQAGDPNRYNIHEGKPPVKLVPEVVETSSKAPEQQTSESSVVVTEKLDEMMSSTEGKTVKKDLKSGLEEGEEMKKKEIMKEDMRTENTDAKLEKNSKPEMEMKKTETKLEKNSKPEMEMMKTETKLEKNSKPEMEMKKTETKLEKKSKPETDMKKPEPISEKKSKPEMDMKTSDVKLEKNSKPETDMKKSDLVSEKKSKPEAEMKKPEGSSSSGGLKVIGDFSEEPASIFRLEGCGPDAYRDSTGKCVIKTTEKGSN